MGDVHDDHGILPRRQWDLLPRIVNVNLVVEAYYQVLGLTHGDPAD
jgi:hypothetical protein